MSPISHPSMFVRFIIRVLFCFILVSSSAVFSETLNAKKAYPIHILSLVEECILHDASYTKRTEMLAMTNQLKRRGYVKKIGSDDLRLSFVNLQGCIEHILACSLAIGETVDLVGMIHTPTPATPLCTLPESLDPTLLAASIRRNPEKMLTVQSRAQIVREYLMNGGKLYAVYPQGGLEKRSVEQQRIFQEELARYPDRLSNWTLTAKSMNPEWIGATYFFRSAQDQKLYVFSIKATQVNDPKQKFEWGLWFGPLENNEISTRVNDVFSYLASVEGPQRELFIR